MMNERKGEQAAVSGFAVVWTPYETGVVPISRCAKR